MNFRIEATSGSKVPFEHVTATLEKALGRIAVQPVRARVTFTDVNGPKKGLDIECALLVKVPGHPSLRVARRAATPRAAFDVAYDIAARRLDDVRERYEESRRHPKKYYAAKRLLA